MSALLAAGIGGIGSALGSYFQAEAAKEAAQLAAQGQRNALTYSQGIYDDTEQRMSPYLEAGRGGLSRLESLTAGMQQPELDYQQKDFKFDPASDPGSQNMIREAMQALNASSYAKGGVGGGAIKAMQKEAGNMGLGAFNSGFQRWGEESKMRYGQASDKYQRSREFQNALLGANQNLAQGGLSAANTLGGFGQTQGGLGAGLMSGMGNTNAMGRMGSANALTQGIQGVAGAAMDYFGSGNKQAAPAFDWSIPQAPENPAPNLGAW